MVAASFIFCLAFAYIMWAAFQVISGR